MSGWPPPLTFADPVLLLGAGPASDATLAALAPRTRAVVAADGGANRLAAAGPRPAAIIGVLS
jgi:Thiamine pyrophosphokinase